ncbi:PAS domain S-box protein [Dongia sp.]|uniref:PAS domain S-box protein n=1 Tax=Dongia sp. TaxID=1977262 RepID=UPI0035B0FAA8
MNMPTTRVMVVEDEGVVAFNLCQRLKKLGYDVPVVVSSGKAALAEIEEKRPDIILMDIHIDGDIDGIETASRIPAEMMVPIIYLTAYSEETTLDRARATRPYGYLLKPFSERELHATIKMALERRASDVAVRDSEERLRLALAAAEMGSWEFDPESEMIAHQPYRGWFSANTEGPVTKSFRDFLARVHDDDRDAVQAAFKQVTNSDQLREIEFRQQVDGGDTRWLRVVGRSFREPPDRRLRIVGVVRDITAQKLAEATHRSSEQSYRDIIATIDGIVWEADRDQNRVTYISDSVERILGYTPQQWLRDSTFWEDHILPEDAPLALATYERAIASGRSYDTSYRMIAADGRPVWIHEVVSMILRDNRTKLIRGVMVDITRQKEIEAEYQLASEQYAESESRLKAILDTAAIGIVTVDSRFRITRFNREAERIFGYSAAEMMGTSLDRLIPDDLRSRHGEHLRQFAAGEMRSLAIGDWRTINGLTADGRTIPLDIVISKVAVGGKTTLTAIMRDMSDTKSREEKLQQLLDERETALLHAENANKAKSSFLAVMSHELRTPLNAIIGFSDLMKREIFGPMSNDRYKQYAIDINESGALLLTIVNSILDLSRIESGRQDLKIAPISFDDSWTSIAHALEALAAQKEIRLDIAAPSAPHRFQGDRHAVAQVLTNLISNAIKFTPNGGMVGVSIAPSGDCSEIILSVRDTGRGIPEDRLVDVFKPFVQVSDSYARDVGGVGLGLAICKSLVEAMSGRIEIESEIGRGTLVRIALPAA